MPVQFLSAYHRATYGRYTGLPTQDELARYFHLDEADLERILSKRGVHNRMGFALQLTTVRYLGRFPDALSDVPAEVVAFVAKQIEVAPLSNQASSVYGQGRRRLYHREEICALYGYREWEAPAVGLRFVRWIYGQCWLGTDRPLLLFERATLWLLAHKVLLPGATLLERWIARLRERVEERVCSVLTQNASMAQQERLESWLGVPDGERRSIFDELRTPQTHISTASLLRALARLNRIRQEGVTTWEDGESRPPQTKCSVSPSRLEALSRFASRAKVTALGRMTRSRRLAILVAFSRSMEANAQDEALEILEQLLGALFGNAAKADQKVRLRHLRDLDEAASTLAQVCSWLLDDSLTSDEASPDIRDAIFARIPREQLVQVVHNAKALVRPPDAVFYRELEADYRRVRAFLPLLLGSVRWQGTPGAIGLIAAWQYLHRHHESGRRHFDDAVPLSIVPSSWRRFVFPSTSPKGKFPSGKTIDICAYTFCILDQLRGAIKRREVFVSPSVRYGDPRQGLLTAAAWETARPLVCRTWGWKSEAGPVLAALADELDATYHRVQKRLPENTAVRFEGVPGHEELVLTPLEKLEESDSLFALRAEVHRRLPHVLRECQGTKNWS